MSPLYTIVLDYAGGTYISQVEAPTVQEALSFWFQRCGDDLRRWKLKAENLRTVIENRAVVALEGLKKCLGRLRQRRTWIDSHQYRSY